MIRIGILIIDDTPDNRPTLEFFKKVEKKYNAKTIILNAKDINFIFSNNLETKNADESTQKKYIYYKNKLVKIDAILPKIDSGSSAEEFLLAINVMDYIRNHTDIVVINYTKGMLISNDKFWQGEYVASHGFKIPMTTFITNRDNISESLKSFEKYPLIVKNQYGAGGSGVGIVESERSAKSVISSMLSKNNNVVVQEYLPVLGGTDYRVYVIGGKAVKGIIRTAPEKEFRANVALGARKKNFIPDKQLSALAVEIANIVGLEIAAVDFMFYKNQYYFIEINKNPGTKNDIKTAEKMLSYVIERCKKKIQNIVIPKKKYYLSNFKSLKKVFKELDYNFFGVDVKSIDALVPAFFIENYGILAYRFTNDLRLLAKYSKVKSMQDDDQDYFNYHSTIKYMDNIEYAKVANYLRKFKNPALFVYDTTPQIERVIESAKTDVIYANKGINYKKYQNRFYFSKLLKKNKINAVDYVEFCASDIVEATYKKFFKLFGKAFNIYLSGKKLNYVKKIFYISNELDFSNFQKNIFDVTYPFHEIENVYISKSSKGIPISVNACIAHKGVLVGYPSYSLLDIPQVNNKTLSKRLKYCGSIWQKDLLKKEVLLRVQKTVKKIGNLMYKNNHYVGLFNLDLRYDEQRDELMVVTCQPRITGSLVIEDLARVFSSEIPMQAFQLLESLKINYDFDFIKYAKKFANPKFFGSNLYLYNRKNKEIMLDKGIKPGIYEYNKQGKIKYVLDSLDFNTLKKNQFIVVESIASIDRTIVLEDDRSQILGLIFPISIYDKGVGFVKPIEKIIGNIYQKLGI